MAVTALPPVQLHQSPAGLEFIIRQEGMKLNAYQDTAGIWTICVGATRDMNGYPVKKGLKYSVEDCLLLLDRDVQDATRSVQKNIRVPLKQFEFDALSSFNFNIGSHAFSLSTLRKVINGDKTGDIYREFLRWDKVTVNGDKVFSKGLHNRRVAEGTLYTEGKYD